MIGIDPDCFQERECVMALRESVRPWTNAGEGNGHCDLSRTNSYTGKGSSKRD